MTSTFGEIFFGKITSINRWREYDEKRGSHNLPFGYEVHNTSSHSKM
jgi:hypothetical protein